MDTSLLDTKIAELTATRETLLTQLEALVEAYIGATIEFLPTEFNRLIEKAVKERPNITQSLGSEKLKALKAEISDLIARVPELVSAQLSAIGIWRHRSPFPTRLDHNYYMKSGQRVESEVNYIMGHMGAILIQHGFAEVGYRSDWIKGVGDIPKYGLDLTTDQAMQKTIWQYESTLHKYADNEQLYRDTMKAKDEMLAKNLWDNA